MTIAGDSVSAGLASDRESPQTHEQHGATHASAFVQHAVVTFHGAGREQAQAVQNLSNACPYGGSMQIAFNDADNNNTLSAGDSFSVTTVNCAIEPGLAANGGITMAFNTLELNGDEPRSFDVTGSFSSFRVGNLVSLNGQFTGSYQANSDGSELTRTVYTNVTSNLLGETMVFNVDFTEALSNGTATVTINGTLGLNGQTYVLAQQDAFTVGTGSNPNAGSLRLRDAAGDTLLLRAKAGDLLDFEFTPVGANTPTVTRVDARWSDFMR